MAPKRTNRDQMNLNFMVMPDDIVSLEGGSQESLSPFELKLRTAVRDTVDNWIRRDPAHDRFEIAARMSRLLGREIMKSHIDNWTAFSSVQRRMHVDALRALCEVTGDWSPLHTLVESCGFKALDPIEAACAEYGALSVMERELASRRKEVQAKMDNPQVINAVIDRAKRGGNT